jgi:hypothetical protein
MSLRLATLAVAIAAMSAISASAATATDDFTGVDFTGVGCTEPAGACTLNNAGADAAVPAFGAADPTCAAGYVAGYVAGPEGSPGPCGDAGGLDVEPGLSPGRQFRGAIPLGETDRRVCRPLELNGSLDATMAQRFGA